MFKKYLMKKKKTDNRKQQKTKVERIKMDVQGGEKGPVFVPKECKNDASPCSPLQVK